MPRPTSVVEPGGLEAAVGDPAGDEHRAGLDVGRAVEQHRAHRAAGLEADDVAGQHHLGAEPGRLRHRAVGEVGAGEALGEAEVVLDRRALPGLAARGVALDDDGLQPLGGGVHRGGEAGRAGADDAEVVERLLGPGAQAERVGELDRGGGAERGAVGDQRPPAGRPAPRRRGRAAAGLVVALDLEPAVGHVVVGEERLDLVRVCSDQRWPTTRTSESRSGWPCAQSRSRSSSTG